MDRIFVVGIAIAVVVLFVYFMTMDDTKEHMYDSRIGLSTRKGKAIFGRGNDYPLVKSYLSVMPTEKFNNLESSELCKSENAKLIQQNRCNQTVSGDRNAGDWMCRNDGYSGYNVAGVGGEEHMTNTKSTQMNKINNRLLSRKFGKTGNEKFMGQTSRSIHLSKPKKESLHETMSVNYGKDPFMVGGEYKSDIGNPNPYRNKAGSPHTIQEKYEEGDAESIEQKKVEDVTQGELNRLADESRAVIGELKKARDDQVADLDTAFGLSPELKNKLMEVEGENEQEQLRHLLESELEKYNKIMLIKEIKDTGVDFDRIPLEAGAEVNDVYRMVKLRRQSRHIGPFPSILGPGECYDETDWQYVMPYNSCDTDVSFKTLREKENYTSYNDECSRSTEYTGFGTEPSNFCATDKYQKAGNKKGLSNYADSHKKLADSCKANWNETNQARMVKGMSPWSVDRYQDGCTFPTAVGDVTQKY